MDKVIADSKKRMAKVVEKLVHDFSTVRTGRASPALLERVKVEYYGSEMPVNQVATISVPEARMLVITPWDKGALKAIEKAVLTSDLDLSPSSDGNVIRLEIPSLTEERRKDLSKLVSQMGEDARIAVRNVRRDANSKLDKMEKAESLSEDAVKGGKRDIQKNTDDTIKDIDEAVETKIAEVMEV